MLEVEALLIQADLDIDDIEFSGKRGKQQQSPPPSPSSQDHLSAANTQQQEREKRDAFRKSSSHVESPAISARPSSDVFRQKGIGVIHDKTLCDYPKYNSSYVKSLEVIENNLLKYPNIEFVFDIHRDAIASQDGTPTKLVCTVNGKSTAQAMIVCGTDAMGLENPNWQENLILALKIQKNLEAVCPGLMRPINLRKERFNMHKTKGSLLFEVGTHGNTLEEALNGAKLLAEGIAETIAK